MRTRRTTTKLGAATFVACLCALTATSGARAGDTLCVGMLTGAHDNVIVPSGAACTLQGAQVKGNVQIQSEGSLLANASMIGGNVEGGNVNFVLLQFETRVGGDLQIKGSNAGTISGHDILTFVGGDSQLEENAGTVFVDAATIGGDLEVKKNTGRLEIEFNLVGGNVKIEDNVVPPTGMSILGNRTPGNLQVVKNSGLGPEAGREQYRRRQPAVLRERASLRRRPQRRGQGRRTVLLGRFGSTQASPTSARPPRRRAAVGVGGARRPVGQQTGRGEPRRQCRPLKRTARAACGWMRSTTRL